MINTKMIKHVVVYGTLRTDDHVNHPGRPDLTGMIRSAGPVEIRASLYDLGPYPGILLDGGGTVQAEILEIVDPRAISLMDVYEEYDPSNPEQSEYLRIPIQLEEHGIEAWVYVYNFPLKPDQRIDNPDWLDYLKQREAA